MLKIDEIPVSFTRLLNLFAFRHILERFLDYGHRTSKIKTMSMDDERHAHTRYLIELARRCVEANWRVF